MLSWKNICGILPKGLPSRLFIIRQSSALPALFRNRDLRNGVPLEFGLACQTTKTSSLSLRFLSSKTSGEKKENSVLQDLVESHEQPQTQLTVGAKGLSSLSFSWSYLHEPQISLALVCDYLPVLRSCPLTLSIEKNYRKKVTLWRGFRENSK